MTMNDAKQMTPKANDGEAKWPLHFPLRVPPCQLRGYFFYRRERRVSSQRTAE